MTVEMTTFLTLQTILSEALFFFVMLVPMRHGWLDDYFYKWWSVATSYIPIPSLERKRKINAYEETSVVLFMPSWFMEEVINLLEAYSGCIFQYDDTWSWNVFILITVVVPVSLLAPRLTPRGPEAYGEILNSVAWRTRIGDHWGANQCLIN